MNVYHRVDELIDQWERVGAELPGDARHLLRQLVKEVVIDCTKVCEARASVTAKMFGVRQEAVKCGDQIRFALFCRDGETTCLSCEGVGCQKCDYLGTRKLAK